MKTEEVFNELLKFKKFVGLKNSSLSTYMYKMHVLLPHLPVSIHDLTEDNLFKAIQELRKDMIPFLKEFIEYANRKGYIDFKTDFIPTLYNKDCKRQINVFTSQEQAKLERYLTENLTYFHFGILLTLYTGIRIGELSALKFKDIKGDLLSINKTLQRIKNLSQEKGPKTTVQIDTPKSSTSIREIPLIPFLIDIIKNLSYTEDNYILTGSNDFMEPRTIERKFEKILELCKIAKRNFHTLRHTFATTAIKKNMKLSILTALMGHSSTKSTEIYLHLDFETKKESMEIFSPSYSTQRQANA